MVYGLRQFYREHMAGLQRECERVARELLPSDRFEILSVSAAGNGVCVVDFADRSVLAARDCEEECRGEVEFAVDMGLLDASSIEDEVRECTMGCEELTELGRVSTVVFDPGTRRIYRATLALEGEAYDLKGPKLFDRLKRSGCTMSVGQEEYVRVVPEEYSYGFEEGPDYVRVDVVDTSRTGRCTVDAVVKALRSIA
jgi:hypothetical protein